MTSSDIVKALIVVLEETPDRSLEISAPRLANLLGVSWSGNEALLKYIKS